MCVKSRIISPASSDSASKKYNKIGATKFKKIEKLETHQTMMRLSFVVVVAVAAIANAESDANLAYSPEDLQGWINAQKVCNS